MREQRAREIHETGESMAMLREAADLLVENHFKMDYFIHAGILHVGNFLS
jgi:hypothetical protein